MRILAVEDDPIQAGSLNDALASIFPNVSFTRVATVQELHAWLQSSESGQLDLIILDGIVPWSRPSREALDDWSDGQVNSPYSGGRECLRLLSESDTTRGTPVIAYTILEREQVFGEGRTPPDHVFHVRKTGGFEQLIVHIRSIMLGVPGEKQLPLGKRLSDAVEAKPGWFGFSVDLKKLFTRRGDTS